jgi:RNA polymerase sigma factor (sigma-70 family)
VVLIYAVRLPGVQLRWIQRRSWAVRVVLGTVRDAGVFGVADALVELGALLRRTARRREAREPLQSGLELARGCGAAPLAARAEEELRAAGASLRDVIRSGVDELTGSERRVAQLAASGMSNKQIAQTLFVAVKTVETHLHRCYKKLDVNSRAQLTSALEPPP